MRKVSWIRFNALMPVIDSLDSAIKASEKWETDEAREITEGIVLIGQQFDEALRKLGVVEIEGVGSQFDPTCTKLFFIAEEEGEPENVVTEVFRKGYKKATASFDTAWSRSSTSEI